MERIGHLRNRWWRSLVSPPVHAGTEPDGGANLRVLVTGATGTLGRRVVGELVKRGHEVAAASLHRVEAVVHAATDAQRPMEVDLGLLSKIIDLTGPEVHLVYPGIVGCDLIPTPYYRAKVLCEELLTSSGRIWSILRATQFHQLIWSWYSRPSRNPWLLVPRATRFQVLDPMEMARRLVDALEARRPGRLEDVGGAFAYEAEELAKSVQAAVGSHRRVVAYNRPGIGGAAFRAGANLTPNRGAGETWNEFVARRLNGPGRTRS